MSTSLPDGGVQPEVPIDALREVIETLAPIERPPCSPGEREAAEWIARRLEAAGCNASVEEESAWGAWPPNVTAIGIVGLVGAALVLLKRRARGALYSLFALLGLLDEIQNGPRIFRRTFRTVKSTANVVASTGDVDARRTLVVLAHHDAAQTGVIFDQRAPRAIHRLRPDASMTRQIPIWWPGLAAPLLSLFSAVTRWRRPGRWGFLLSAAGLGFVSNIMRSPTVPGANDNLSGVAVLVGLAASLRNRPIEGVRVVLVSAGAEEGFQEGIRGFMERHRSELDPGSTWFLNVDTVGSDHLVMVEGEGPAWMEDYTAPRYRDLVAGCASEQGIPLIRGVRTRVSTDGIVPSRAGYPTATLISLMPWGMPGNYHQMSDVPGNVRYATVVDAVRLAYAVGERLKTH